MVTKRMLRRFPRLHAAYRGYRESKQLVQSPTRTPQGFWLAGNSSMQSGQFEPVETNVVNGLLADVEVLINIGANIGYYCCLALMQKKQVVAFEPMPNNLKMLIRNMERNGWERAIEIFPMALSSEVGIAKIYGGGTGASLVKGWAGQAEENVTSVPMSTLDIMLGERFQGARCLMVVDIEGAELAMLRGATNMLQANPKPVWMVEISITEHQPAGVGINPHLVETFELFAAAGYQAFTAEQTPREISMEEVRQVASSGCDTLQTHNFIFRGAT